MPTIDTKLNTTTAKKLRTKFSFFILSVPSVSEFTFKFVLIVLMFLAAYIIYAFLAGVGIM
jgi:hypothetical protein